MGIFSNEQDLQRQIDTQTVDIGVLSRRTSRLESRRAQAMYERDRMRDEISALRKRIGELEKPQPVYIYPQPVPAPWYVCYPPGYVHFYPGTGSTPE